MASPTKTCCGWPARRRRAIRWVLTDIDDTLTTDGAITSDALEALGKLKAAGLHVVAITGRPVGWSEPFARDWPVDAIVAENGAVALTTSPIGLQPAPALRGALSKLYQQSDAVRAANFARMQQVAQRVLRDVPGVETHLVISAAGKLNVALETDRKALQVAKTAVESAAEAGKYDDAKKIFETIANTKEWRGHATANALRMLGELVDVQFDQAPGATLAPGDVVGSIEGFKAVSDVYGIGHGTFVRANPALNGSLESLVQKPYDTGWMYEFRGKPDDRILDLDGYRALLDATIDRMLEKQQQHEQP